jgi:hypothetical protein
VGIAVHDGPSSFGEGLSNAIVFRMQGVWQESSLHQPVQGVLNSTCVITYWIGGLASIDECLEECNFGSENAWT